MNATQHVTALGQASGWTPVAQPGPRRHAGQTDCRGRRVGRDLESVDFQKRWPASPYYADDLVRLKAGELNAEQRYEALVIPDIQDACDLMLPVYERSDGHDGYVSLEVAPRWAYDAART